MQKQKNIRLLVSLGVIVIITALLPLLKNHSNGLSIDKRQFTLDPQTVITDVILSSDSIHNELRYINGKWVVNNKYDLDPNMRDIFFSVISQMEIRKSVPSSLNDSIKNLIRAKGIKVSILNSEEIIKAYFIWGDNTSQKSYIMNESQKKAYMLQLPGYRSFVASIFQVPEFDWRSRRVFSTIFTNLNMLTISYPNETISYRYKDRFFEIEGVSADSTKLINSLENLLFLQTDQYIQPSEASIYMHSNFQLKHPLSTIAITKLSGIQENVSIYAIENNPTFLLGITSDSSYCLFNKKRLNTIMVKNEDFH